MTAALLGLVLLQAAALVLAVCLLRRNSREKTFYTSRDHAFCVVHLAEKVGNAHAADVLDQAARDFTSARGQIELDRIVAEKNFSPRQPIPARWLADRAKALRDG